MSKNQYAEIPYEIKKVSTNIYVFVTPCPFVHIEGQKRFVCSVGSQTCRKCDNFVENDRDKMIVKCSHPDNFK